MPQGSSTAPGWFVKAINEVTKGLANVSVYLVGVIIFDPDPAARVPNIKEVFELLKNKTQALAVEGEDGCHRRGFPRPHYLPRGYSAERL